MAEKKSQKKAITKKNTTNKLKSKVSKTSKNSKGNIKTPKKSPSKIKNLNNVSAVPKPSSKAPNFMNINDRNKRNNYGFYSNSDVSKKLSAINKRLKDKPREWIHKPIKKNKSDLLKYFAIILITAIVVLTIVFVIKTISDNQYIENGKCLITIKTVLQGKEIKQTLDLPNIECNKIEDCEMALIEKKFASDHINKMNLKCVPE